MSSATKLYDDFWQWRLKEFPEFASFVGFHDYDDQLNDHSHEAFQRRLGIAQYVVDDFSSTTGWEPGVSKVFVKRCEETLREETFLTEYAEDVAGFLKRAESLQNDPEADWISIERLKDDLKTFQSGCKYQGYVFACHTMEGMHVDFEQLTSWMEFQTIQDYQRYVGRLKGIPKRLSQDEDNMRLGISTGKTLHAVSMEGVCSHMQSMVDGQAEGSVFYEPFKRAPEDLEKYDAFTALRDEALNVINSAIKPAFGKMKTFVEKEYIPACRSEVGISCVPGGRALYQECLDWHLSLHMSPEEVHALGQREVARIKEAMNKVIEETGFEGDFKAFTDFLRSDPQFIYPTKEEAMQGYRDLCGKVIRPTLSKIFHKIPQSELIIQATPESRPNAPMGYYLAGTLDGRRPGIYYVNATNLSENKKYDMMTLSLHEGEPGHHFQGMYAIEATDVHEFRRYAEDMYYLLAPTHFPFYTAYLEGWGLYCEWLGNELGLYDADPYSRFGHLSFEMLRACRLVADTGLHVMGWSYDQAIALFTENTSLAPKFIRTEVTRYCSFPAQACAYKVGQLKIMELRRKATEALGEEFDVRDFHEEILQCGAVPLSLMEKIVDKYIERVLKK